MAVGSAWMDGIRWAGAAEIERVRRQMSEVVNLGVASAYVHLDFKQVSDHSKSRASGKTISAAPSAGGSYNSERTAST